MASSEDKTRYDDTMKRIRALIEKHPEANTTALQVMLLQADYNRAESEIAAWTSEPRNVAARQEATTILTRIAPQLLHHQQTLTAQADAMLAEIDKIGQGDLLQTRERELQRLQGVVARASYFAAWSSYYFALVTDAKPGAEPYLKARDIFRKLLGFEEDLPEETDVQWLELESVWRSRSLIGLAMTEAACGNLEACDRCFRILEQASVPPEIKDQLPYWNLRALLDSGQLERVEALASQRVASLKPPSTPGQVSFCVALVRAGFGADGEPSAQQQSLGNHGLNGLARLGQLAALEKLIEKYGIQARDDSGFVSLWAQGQKQFAAADASKTPADYEQAVRTLQAALRTRDAKTLTGPASRCQYTLAWCHYRLGDFEAAAREFGHAVTGLTATEDPLAVESAWMTFVAYRRLIEKQPRFATEASDALKRIQRNFPDHPYAQRAEYELARLTQDSDPDEMLRRLASIKPDDDNYVSACFDLCSLWHRRWSQDKGDRRLAPQRLESLRLAAETFLKAAARDPDPQQSAKCCLLVADAALHGPEPDLATASAFLERADPWVAKLPATNAVVQEYHYRCLELATAQSDQSQRRAHAQWLTENASGSPYELAALMIVANALDREAAATAQDAALQKQAYAAFQRLVSLLGSSPDALTSSNNARIAHSRLAHYAFAASQFPTAADTLDRLLAVAPRDKGYLRRAVQRTSPPDNTNRRCNTAARSWLAFPRAPTSGTKRNSTSSGTLATDRDQARKVLQQLKLLHPDLGGAKWSSQFQELDI